MGHKGKAKSKGKVDGSKKELERQRKIRDSKQDIVAIAERIEREEKEEEEKKMLRKQEEESEMKKFGNLIYLVFEFPKGGLFQNLKDYLSLMKMVRPCRVKGIYPEKDIIDADAAIHNAMYRSYENRRNKFISLLMYDDELKCFLKTFMSYLGERRYFVNDNEWWICYYWRMQWLKHGDPRQIKEMDFYRKIHRLYLKAPVDMILKKWWRYQAKCKFDEIIAFVASDLLATIHQETEHKPAIFANGFTKGLRQVYIGFDWQENFQDVICSTYNCVDPHSVLHV